MLLLPGLLKMLPGHSMTVAELRFRSRPRRALVHIVVAITAAIVLSGCTGGRKSVSSTSTAGAPVASVSPSVFTVPPKDVAVLEAGLASIDPAVEAKALTAALRTKSNLAAEPLLPAGSRVTIDAGKATRYGDVARVPATVTGPRPGRFMLLLIRAGGSWLLYGTEQLG
jgi:hypothetical protein